VQDRPLALGDQPLGLVEQPETGLDPATFRFRPGQAEQEPAADLQEHRIIAGGVAAG
jgi:hypothetical protein